MSRAADLDDCSELIASSMIRKYLIDDMHEKLNMKRVTLIAKLLDDNNCPYNEDSRQEENLRKSDITMRRRKIED